MESQMIDLTPQQVRNAAQAGVTLLNTPGAVNVPSTMSITGVTQVLHAKRHYQYRHHKLRLNQKIRK
jgi:hypothetical protein